MGFVRLTGVTLCDKNLAYDTFILFTGADGNTRLIDLNGKVVHSWSHGGVPPRILNPAETGGKRGNVGLQLAPSGDIRGGIYANGIVGELDWDGKCLWKWGSEHPDGAARQNHDWELLPNGRWLLLTTTPRILTHLSPREIGDQGLVEVTRAGDVVWRWSSGDHVHQLGLSDEGMKRMRETIARNPDDPWGFLEMNSAATLGPNQWYENDPVKFAMFHPDNIIVSFRKANVVAIIEKSSGDIIWRLGPYFDEKPGDQHQRLLRFNVPRPLDQLSGQHNPHFIPKGFPGAGNILLFDCQGGAGYPPAPLGIYAGSRVLEVNPVTKEIVWQYTAEDSGLPVWTFSSSFVSNAQRLPNGNTLITEGMQGRMFQITPRGQAAWEYVSPYSGLGVAGEPEVKTVRVVGMDRLSRTSLVYRAQAVPDDWVPEGVKREAAISVDRSA